MTSANPSKRAHCTPAWCLSTYVLVLALASGCSGHSSSSDSEASPVNLRTLITGTFKDIRHDVENVVGTNVIQSTIERVALYLESMLGQDNFYTVAMFVEMVIRFLAEGAASGLNVIAVYVTEILRVTGIHVPLSLPRFTPEGVASVAQWGLLALIGYWLLTVILRLFIGLLRQVFWILKTVAALWLFGLIVSDAQAGTDTTAIRLAGLVLGCALLGVAFPSSEKTVGVEGRLGQLEGRVRALEGRKGED
ncbi:transmembrane protein 109 isoform X1 [Gadus macrocephalus]|uniref:transmembrane protein 109 isoform X1 n=1 Tax=Gadus macrocephalus TaxID=80720 RepID=UPI0028CB964D|nr:transmembrane protein 109 isoform X1 [Gadus macrocephalus]XP_059918408.1 transmembrane protein 109 isoform X1 [Gadus macrocephalus]XP_059918409.1 transmembrane protein 109 isoform X1 [Gadus macrocephalus]XP_059918410.1 transmembrane protein 109 isoform X1 [Gadus macrocephalus]